MQEYFAKEKKNSEFILSEQDIFHIQKVLRMKQGERLVVIYENNKYECNVTFDGGIKINLIKELDVNNELTKDITLIYGVPKKDKFEMVIQKSCELGVSKIVPFLAKRSIPVIDEKNESKKIERWNLIAKEACEQSRRNKLVNVTGPIKLNDVLNYKSELNIIAYEDMSCDGSKHLFDLLTQEYNSITMVVGPEGGFDPTEVKYLNDNGFISVSLGKRILRSETAPLYLMSVISFMDERNI